MAIHGVVRVNTRPVIGYEIIRGQETQAEAIAPEHKYRYEVQRLGRNGALATVRGELMHKYEDGPEVLVAAVLVEAGAQFRAQEGEVELAIANKPSSKG